MGCMMNRTEEGTSYAGERRDCSGQALEAEGPDSPHEINLCPMLPHHPLLHAKSLPGPNVRAPPKPEAGFRPFLSQVYILAFRQCHVLTQRR